MLAEGRVNPGEVSGDGKVVVYGEYDPSAGESVYRWEDGKAEKLNTDGYSSWQAHCNYDGSAVTYHRYSLEDPKDKNGNSDLVRWKNGKTEFVAKTDEDEEDPSIDYSGDKIVYSRNIDKGRSSQIVEWESGEGKVLTDGAEADSFPEISGNGARITFRRHYDNIFLHDQNGVTKPVMTEGTKPGSLTIDREGSKLLYAAHDEDGDQNLYLTDLNTSKTVEIAALAGVDEYEGAISGDGSTIVYTGIDRRKGGGDMNVYVWKDGKSQQLTWNDGGRNYKPSVSYDGKAISWFWTNLNDINDRKVLLWQKDQPAS